MQQQLLYRKLAQYYDLIYRWKNYRAETQKIFKLIRKHQKSTGKELLELACGTGKHLQYLQKKFRCTGVDLNPAMLQIARKNVPGITLHRQDMTRLHLGKKFDIILCLFGSIGYVRTSTGLLRTVRNIAQHLHPGGVVIIEPWLTPQTFRPGTPYVGTYNGEGIKVVRVGTSRKRGNLSFLQMHFLVAKQHKPIQYFQDEHVMGLFTVQKTLEAMRKAGLQPRFLKQGLMSGRGLLIGTK